MHPLILKEVQSISLIFFVISNNIIVTAIMPVLNLLRSLLSKQNTFNYNL
ncbi:hypothetical protein FHW89_004368 [Mucilaginibacter sp. SG564]|nr:hypothetical protein [Mucilaginibacter sp. SG564]